MVIFLSDIPWDALYQRPQHLASRLASKETVIWVEPATLGRHTYWNIVQLVSGLYRLTVPMIPLNARSSLIKNIARAAGRIKTVRLTVESVQRTLLKRALRTVGKDEPCFLIENFQLVHMARDFPENRVVFDYIDDAFGFTEYPQFVTDLWEETLQRADATIATSPTLAQRIAKSSLGPVTIIPNGVEFERFAGKEELVRPSDMPLPGTPIVGYTGSVYPWMDFGMLERAMELLPQFQFVLIGQAHTDVVPTLRRLEKYANFRFLGPKPYSEMPKYLHCFDVGIIPFLRNRLTEGVNPVKLYEYCAASVPAVVSEFSDDLRTFEDLVFVARTPDEFAENIRKAAHAHADPTFINALLEFARSNDWNQRYLDVARLVHVQP